MDMDYDNRMSALAAQTLIVVLLLSSTDHWDLWHMNCLVDRTTIWIWCRCLARAGFPVQTTANDDRRLTAIID